MVSATGTQARRPRNVDVVAPGQVEVGAHPQTVAVEAVPVEVPAGVERDACGERRGEQFRRGGCLVGATGVDGLVDGEAMARTRIS